LLKVEKLNVKYGTAQVLFDIDFEVNKGTIVSLLGANGAGKSTILNAISGIHPKASGSIKFNNEEIGGLQSHEIVERGIVQVPEGRRLFPELTIKENLELGAFNKSARKSMKKNLEFVYSILPKLEERSNQLANTLSGGERQMVAIGRALMAEPKILLMDEPSLGLAPIIVQDVFKLIKKIHSEGQTIILVEQNVNNALSIADYGYVVEIGRVVLSGEGGDLLKHPELKKAYLGM